MNEEEEYIWQFDGIQTPEDIGMPQDVFDYFMSLGVVDDVPICTAISHEGFGCTRKLNHGGVHVAHGIHHLCAIWADKEIPIDESSDQIPNEQVDNLRDQFQSVQ